MEIVEQIKSKIDIAEYIGKTTTLTQKGIHFLGLCPFHPEKTPSFYVTPKKQMYHCYGCGKNGDIFNFLEETRGLTFYEALKELAEYAGLSIDTTKIEAKAKVKKFVAPKMPIPKKETKANFNPQAKESPADFDVWQEKATKFLNSSCEALLENQKQIEYLEKRGISLEAIKLFKIGYNPKATFRDAESWGLPLFVKKNNQRNKIYFPQGIVVPNFRGKELQSLKIRNENWKKESNYPRYNFITGGAPVFMVLFPNRKTFCLVETELDAVMIASKQNYCGVIACGSASAKPDSHTFQILKNSKQILNALDFDVAGKIASEFWAETFKQSKRWITPKGKDPGEAFELGVNIKEWIKAGLSPVYTLNELQQKKETSLQKETQPNIENPDDILASFFKKYGVRYECRDGFKFNFKHHDIGNHQILALIDLIKFTAENDVSVNIENEVAKIKENSFVKAVLQTFKGEIA